MCRKAIAIDPSRYNAHKNLGIALEDAQVITANLPRFTRIEGLRIRHWT